MSDSQRPLSEWSRQELLDEIYYLRDIAGEREQQVRRLEGRIEEILRSPTLRWTAPLRRLVRIWRYAGSMGAKFRHVLSKGRPAAIERRRGNIKHLYVDVTALVLHGGMTGVQRVTREIMKALLAAPPVGFDVCPVYGELGQPYRLTKAFAAGEDDGEMRVLVRDAQVLTRAGDVFLGLDHAMETVAERLREFAEMRQRGVRIWFVCHDTLPLDHPDWFSAEVPPRFEKWLRAVLQVADGVVCNSRSTESGVLRWLGSWNVPRHRSLQLDHFGLGATLSVGNSETGAIDSELLAQLAGKAVFLMVGTLEPRKGHGQALEAFNRLWAEDEEVVLVIAGLPGWKTEVIQRRIRHHEEFGRRLFWFMDASDGLLEQLYQSSTALLAPSEGEGFGLPLVEAARHGLPILCRDLPVFREVAGAHATYFDGRDPDSLACAIRSWIRAWRRREVPDSRGIRCLTWAESAQELMDVVLQSAGAAQSVPT